MSYLDSSPFTPPKSHLADTPLTRSDKHLIIAVFACVFTLISSTIQIIIGYKIMPVFAQMYEGMGSSIPLLTRFAIDPFSIKVMPILIMLLVMTLSFYPKLMKRHAKLTLVVLTTLSIVLPPLVIYAVYLPVNGI